jgi:NAD(P)-dependent dehydrogenase (short-subunit alcohol dehydrogenase family)
MSGQRMQIERMFALDGQVAFVTGAAKGLGFAMSEILAQAGAKVVLSDVDPDALATALGRLTAMGFKVDGELVDVDETEHLAQTIDQVAQRNGRLDIVIANAGLSAGPGPLTETGSVTLIDHERWQRLLNINLTSVMVTIKTAARHMIAKRYGRIVVTASIAGMRGDPMCGYAYAVTKAGVINLVRQSAIELSKHDITINAIAPGPFLTDIGNRRLHDPAVAAGFLDSVPLGRLGQPDEIQGLALLLASPASSFMTGSVIPVDGGSIAF